jgi:hypothetical protein
MISFGFPCKIFYPLLFISNQKKKLCFSYDQFFLNISMTPPKICSMEENNSQQFGNLISQQTTNSKSLLPPSAVG